MAGFAVIASSRMAADFARWGFPEWARYAVGTVEMVAAGLLLVPRATRLAAVFLAVVMVGALLTHAVHREWDRALVPLVLLVLLGGVAVIDTPRS
jgi:uncharacterized membrane protein YphA (DoxX/SURF4 family)